MAWLNAIEAFQETGNELPVNLKVRITEGNHVCPPPKKKDKNWALNRSFLLYSNEPCGM